MVTVTPRILICNVKKIIKMKIIIIITIIIIVIIIVIVKIIVMNNNYFFDDDDNWSILFFELRLHLYLKTTVEIFHYSSLASPSQSSVMKPATACMDPSR